MNTTIETLDSATIVKATGRLDFEASASFQKELEQAIANAAARKAAVAINCEGIEYVSSAGLRVFLVAARAAKSAAIGFGVCSLTAGVKEVFDISGFGRIIDVFPDQAAALAKFSTPA
jgi:anti-anti-sigma factor